MARIEVDTHIEAPPSRVWEALTDWEGQARWMRDARSVRVVSDRREGTDVVLACPTDIAFGLVVTDEMVVTEWVPERLLAVRHVGWLIRGIAAFEMEPTAHGTRLVWWEEINMPLGGFGETLAEMLLVPRVKRLFRSSLAGLKRVCESTSVRP